MKKVGTVDHYYGKIGVATVKLSGTLKVGDRIKIKDGENEFEQTVSSMQVEHKKVEEAKKGEVIGLEVAGKAREGAIVNLLKE